ncbi:MAG: PEGA domain-containing protein [Kiritimatiellia bacterium]
MSTVVNLALANEPMRVAVLDFENRASSLPSYLPSELLSSDSLAEKGAFLVNKQLAGRDDFRLIDRRDFFDQLERLKVEAGKEPSFLRAARQVNADVVLRGSLLTISTSRSSVNQGGYRSTLDDVTIRVGLEALDARDGSVLAAADGAASRRFRQTDAVQTIMGEDDLLQLMAGALDEAIPSVGTALAAWRDDQGEQPVIKLSVTTSDDPALIEIDGVLIGSTPLTDFEVYRGDHTITIGKPGFRDISKRILLEKDTRIEVPMLRTELSADELKEILEKARLNIYSGLESGIIIQTIDD